MFNALPHCNTAAKRRNELRNCFSNVVNLSLPPHLLESPLLHPGTSLLPKEAFNIAPASTAEVLHLAEKSSSGKGLGPDGVPIEALRIPRVAEEIARAMNAVLESG